MIMIICYSSSFIVLLTQQGLATTEMDSIRCIDNTHQKVMGGYLVFFPYMYCLYTNAVMKLRKCT